MWVFGSWRIVGAVLVAALLAGCTAEAPSVAVASTSTESAVVSSAPLAAVPAFTNDLAQGSAHREILIPGETFSLTVDYWLTTDPAAWTSLGAKTVHFSVHTVTPAGSSPGADQPTVLVEFSEATAVLRSTGSGLDGQLVQSARDAPATGAVPGYVVNADLPYEGVFGVTANSPSILGRWAELGHQTPADSAALAAAGVYANEISFTYSLLIRGAGAAADSFWHRRLVQDVLTIGTPDG